MIIPFKLNSNVASTYITGQTVRAVVHRMGGANNQEDFTYHGKSKDGGIKEHRIREIQECGDLGSPYTNAYWYFSHHTGEAISELDSHLDQWDFMAKHLGNDDVFKRVEGFMARTGERIEPACFAINEADIDGQAKKSYQDVCDRWTKRCSSERQSYKDQKNLTTKNQRRAIRQAGVAAAKEILAGFRGDLSAWVSEINGQIQ